MKTPSFLSSSIVMALCVLASAMSSSALSVEIHTTSEISGRQGNLLNFVAKHTGNLPNNPFMFFYVVDQNGVTQNLGRQGTSVGELWWMSWIAGAPGTYRMYAVLRNGHLENSLEVARTQLATVTIQGSAVELHSTSELSGRQGNLLSFVAKHTGNLPNNPFMFFYVVDQNGVTQNLGRQGTSVGELWRMSWIAGAPGTYRMYAVLRNGHLENSLEVARTQLATVTIQGSAVELHSTSELSGRQGNLLSFVAKHTGNLPNNPFMFFYVVDQNGVTQNLGRQGTSVGELWWMSWIAGAPGTYRMYAVLRNGHLEDSLEVARTQIATVTIQGSAIQMHTSTTSIVAGGKPATVVAATQGNLSSNSFVFFYAVDKNSQVTFQLGRTSAEVGKLWSRQWTPEYTGNFYIYAVLRNGHLEDSQELARTGNFVVVPEGTRIPDPFETVAGTYQALLPGGSRPMLTVQLTAKGALSGRLVLNGLTYPFSGQLASDGTAVIRSDLRNQPSVSLVLRSDSSSRMISGNYSLGQQSPVEFTLLPPAYVGKGSDVSPLSKKTANALLVSESDGTNPLGHGYFRATFDAKGGARVAGKMPDGRRLTGYAPALGTGVAGKTTLTLSVVWKGKALATLIGDLEVRENAGESAPLLEGAVEWNAPADPKRKVLPEAIQADFTVVGNLWATVAGRNPLTSTGESVNFTFQADSGANILGSALSAVGAWGTAAQPAISGLPAGTKWKYAPKTGIFTGQIPGSPGRLVLEGLLVPRSELTVDGNLLFGGGFLIGKGASAPVELLEAD
jgi:hypothetical protein